MMSACSLRISGVGFAQMPATAHCAARGVVVFEGFQLHCVDVGSGEDLAGGGIDFVEIRRADEPLNQRDVRSVRRIQGKTFRENAEQAGVVGCAVVQHRGVRFQQDVNGGDLEREDLFPIVLHADDGPAGFLRFVVNRLRERTQLGVRQALRRTVGVFARHVIMQHEKLEPGTAAALRVFQHLLIAPRIAERGDGPAADVLVDGDGLAVFVVIEVELRQPHDHRLAVAHFKLRLDAAADDLFRRDAVNLFRPWAHELDATAGDDVVLETVRAQIGEQFEHRLINHFGVELAGLRMFRDGDPILDDLFKLHRGHAHVRGHDEFDERVVTAGKRGFQIALEQRGERFLGFPFGMLRRERLHAVEREVELNGNRLLTPERAVVVERGDAFRDWHEVRGAGLGDLFDEGHDGLLGWPVVPGRQEGVDWVCANSCSGTTNRGAKFTPRHIRK